MTVYLILLLPSCQGIFVDKPLWLVYHQLFRMEKSPLLISLLFGLAAGIANLLGGIVVLYAKRLNPHFLKYFIAFGSGFLLAAVFLKMIPISLELSPLSP